MAEVPGRRLAAVSEKHPHGTYQVRRCICGAVWNTHADFAVCERCGEDVEICTLYRESPDEAAPTHIEGLRYRAALRERRAQESAREQAQRAASIEPLISAATAALDYDLDHWLTPEGEAWTTDP